MSSLDSLSDCQSALLLIDQRFGKVMQAIRHAESSAADRGRELIRLEAALLSLGESAVESGDNADEAADSAAKAKADVSAVEEAIKDIKDKEERLKANTLTVRCSTINGLEGQSSSSSVCIIVSCSSPIEERTLSVGESSAVSFFGVDRDVAILQLAVHSSTPSAVIGVSASLDAMPLCYLTDEWLLDEANVVDCTAVMRTTEEVRIVKEGSVESAGFDTADEEGASAVVGSSVCSVVLQFDFTPSREERHIKCVELLTALGRDKARVKQRAAELQAAGEGDEEEELQAASPTARSPKKKEGVVKSGFLNKAAGLSPSAAAAAASAASEEQQPPRWRRMFSGAVASTIKWTTFAWAVAPVAKNYVLFIAAVLAIHFKGDDVLALPPPI